MDELSSLSLRFDIHRSTPTPNIESRSIREARHAGHQPASAPTAANITAAPTIVAGSRGSSP